MSVRASEALINEVTVCAYTIPTDLPESDGTLEWNATTLVVADVRAGGLSGLGLGYADTATAKLIQDRLGPLLVGQDAFAIGARFADMVHNIRNLGRPGVASMAISVLDIALWDLKAKLLDVPLAVLLGSVRSEERRVGNECVSTCRSRWSHNH